MENMENVQSVRTKLEQYQSTSDLKLKNTMSVSEMRRLLGLKKTESYWLVHRDFFETKIIDGKMRVDIASFEKWYANQVKHKKVNGEEPGLELAKTSYSFKDAANLLGIHDANLYEIWRTENLETITVDFVRRIPIDAFNRWYENQIMFQKKDKLPTITELEKDYIPLADAAELLEITREKLSVITRTSRFKELFEIQVFDSKKWISKSSFQKFLNAQNVYQVRKRTKMELLLDDKEESAEKFAAKEMIKRQEAADLAGVTTATITKWMQLGRFSYAGAGRSLRINRNEFLAWLKEYQEGGV